MLGSCRELFKWSTITLQQCFQREVEFHQIQTGNECGFWMADFRRLQNEKIFNPKLFPVHVNQVNVFHDDPREPGGKVVLQRKRAEVVVLLIHLILCLLVLAQQMGNSRQTFPSGGHAMNMMRIQKLQRKQFRSQSSRNPQSEEGGRQTLLSRRSI